METGLTMKEQMHKHFMVVLKKLCLENGCCISVSDCDSIQICELDPINCNGIENKLNDMTKTNIHETKDGRIVVNKLRPMSEAVGDITKNQILIYYRSDNPKVDDIFPESSDYNFTIDKWTYRKIKGYSIIGWLLMPEYSEQKEINHRRRLEEMSNLAFLGDTEALNKLPEAVRLFLEQSRSEGE